MKKHARFWLKSLGATCVAAALLWTVPDLAAERFAAVMGARPVSPISEAGVQRVALQLQVPAAIHLAGQALIGAQQAAELRTVEVADELALGAAREAFWQDDDARAAQLLEVLITRRKEQLSKKDVPKKQRKALGEELLHAQFLQAHVFERMGQPARAAAVLGELEGKTPVEDFVQWLRGQALREAGNPGEAARAMQRAFDQDTTLVKLRAQVGLAHALAESGDHKAALPVLEQVIEAFPLYPRRHRLLFARAHALEQLGRLDEAARAYQTAWFEFPDKHEGADARQAMRRLAAQGHAAAPIPARQLFERYRLLRIDKHWELAKELFQELLAAHKTPEGTSAFEHEIIAQLALNDFIPQNNEDTMAWLQVLKKDYEAGHTAGIDRDFLYRYLSETYARLGDFDQALSALQVRLAPRNRPSQQRAMAEFLLEHGRYAQARKIYDEIETQWNKLGWDYTWLLYKTGDYQQAYENLTRLAERAQGERRAKYMYWAARTLALDGNVEEAGRLYEDVARVYEQGYYGIQAANRLLDLQQGQAVDGQVIAHTRGIVDGATKALALLDEAADSADSDRRSDAAAYGDPRTRPRVAGGDEAPATRSAPALTPPQAVALEKRQVQVDCALEHPDAREFCELLQGQGARSGRDALHAALWPYLPYTGLMGAASALLSRDEAVAALDDEGAAREDAVAGEGGIDARPPRRDVRLSTHRAQQDRHTAPTLARIYWEGRRDSPVAFVSAAQGRAIGPLPSHPWAYDESNYQDGLERAIAAAGDLFPQLERAKWLRDAGYTMYARWAIRDLALEYDGLRSLARPSARPIELSTKRWNYLIDNRRKKSGVWGFRSEEPRFAVPGPAAARDALLKRQQQIYDRRAELGPLVMDALKAVGDYHIVRKFNFGTGPWYRADPTGELRHKWMQAYPRAFPRQVIHDSLKNGVNPYLVWAVMTVESTYNPDAISYADALGLLQVIPRTGIKTAEMLGEEDFGPMDLLDEDVAIRHGAFYLSKLVNKFRGQELLAVAGYNGGPHRVGEWMDKRGRDMPLDEFIEEIPFDQARGYTKKVTRYLALYLRIYEGVDQLYIGQTMRLDYLADPNF